MNVKNFNGGFSHCSQNWFLVDIVREKGIFIGKLKKPKRKTRYLFCFKR